MKIVKNSFFVILLVIIVFGYSPLESTAITLNEAEMLNKTIQSNPKESIPEINDTKVVDGKMVIQPQYNCDPRIMITNVPDIDPHILLEELP